MRRTMAIGAALGTLLIGAAMPAHTTSPAGWSTAVARIIADHQSYPRSAELRREQGTTRLRVSVAANGHVSQVDIIESSGSAILDLQARSTITDIGRLPAPPPGTSIVIVPIVWRLE